MTMTLKWLIPAVLIVCLACMSCSSIFGHHHDEKCEEEVTLEEVPAAVKAMITKEAGDNEIDEIEKITTKKGTYYEAEWEIEGAEVEILVGSDGKLLRKEIEYEHDDDDDDDEEDDD